MKCPTLPERCRRLLYPFLILLILGSPALAGVLSVIVSDGSGAPMKDVLVIVQDLRVRDADEVFRALTDEHGQVPSRDLPAGNYRIISTTPYGLWKPDIRELFIGTSPVEVTPRLDVVPTHGYGDVIVLPETHFEIEVKHQDGTPVEGAAVLVRDSEATLASRHWFRTDKNGTVKVMASGDDVILVTFSGNHVVTRDLTKEKASLHKGISIVVP